ncbi:hypothetical protein NDU88_007013 [Pleurodeles waltl]|uniref:Uncharacterized protein n=1 Tax=Pleurodeles waltl TaxID=8319 RepID=A0AAV7UPU7_PLEWA|nr:hypothetical protein NDU88_007013 [Pleurodeles waltl]
MASGVRVCSRQLEVPATSLAKSATESGFPYPCDEREGFGNPSGRIPEPIQGHQDNADTGSQENEKRRGTTRGRGSK